VREHSVRVQRFTNANLNAENSVDNPNIESLSVSGKLPAHHNPNSVGGNVSPLESIKKTTAAVSTTNDTQPSELVNKQTMNGVVSTPNSTTGPKSAEDQ
jgi:hypothetical protein